MKKIKLCIHRNAEDYGLDQIQNARQSILSHSVIHAMLLPLLTRDSVFFQKMHNAYCYHLTQKTLKARNTCQWCVNMVSSMTKNVCQWWGKSKFNKLKQHRIYRISYRNNYGLLSIFAHL